MRFLHHLMVSATLAITLAAALTLTPAMLIIAARLRPRAQVRGVHAVAYLPASPAEQLQVGCCRQDRQPGLAGVTAP